MTKLIKKFQSSGQFLRTNYVVPLTKKEETDINSENFEYISPNLSFAWKDNVSEEDRKAIEAMMSENASGGVPVPLITKTALKEIDKENYKNNNIRLNALRKFGYKKALDGKLGSGFKKAEAEANRLGYFWDATTQSYVKKEPIKITTVQDESPSFFSSIFSKQYDNMYPYSYGDMVVDKSGNKRVYDGGTLQEGEHLVLTSGKESISDLISSMWAKAKASFTGKDPRREYMERLADLDLSTPEGLKEWKTLSQEAAKNGVIRVKGDPINDQWELRARLDNMSMYLNGTLKYNTYEVNSDYTSGNAEAKGAKTYRIADSKQRNRINGEMYNYFINNAKKVKWYNRADLTEDQRKLDKYKYLYKIDDNGNYTYFMPNMGYLGNQTIVADDLSGKNMRHSDNWDYIWSNYDLGHLDFYTGDKLADESGKALYSAKGVGHNGNSFSESTDGLLSAFWEEQKNEIQKEISNRLKQSLSLIKKHKA